MVLVVIFCGITCNILCYQLWSLVVSVTISRVISCNTSCHQLQVLSLCIFYLISVYLLSYQCLSLVFACSSSIFNQLSLSLKCRCLACYYTSLVLIFCNRSQLFALCVFISLFFNDLCFFTVFFSFLKWLLINRIL